MLWVEIPIILSVTGDSARGFQREIGLPEMHSVGVGENRDIDSVVDDESCAALAAHLGDCARCGQEIAAGRIFEA